MYFMEKIYLVSLSRLFFETAMFINFKKKTIAVLAIVICSLMNITANAQSVQTLPFPSNNNQTGVPAAPGGFYGPMAATTTLNQYSRYAYVYPQSLLNGSTGNATGTISSG